MASPLIPTSCTALPLQVTPRLLSRAVEGEGEKSREDTQAICPEGQLPYILCEDVRWTMEYINT